MVLALWHPGCARRTSLCHTVPMTDDVSQRNGFCCPAQKKKNKQLGRFHEFRGPGGRRLSPRMRKSDWKQERSQAPLIPLASSFLPPAGLGRLVTRFQDRLDSLGSEKVPLALAELSKKSGRADLKISILPPVRCRCALPRLRTGLTSGRRISSPSSTSVDDFEHSGLALPIPKGKCCHRCVLSI